MTQTAALKNKKTTLSQGTFVQNTIKTANSGGNVYLTYYGARYLDPKTSRWLSGDPALGEYVPLAPLGENERKHNSNLPGMGGVFNLVNLHVYHYAGNNPVKYVDPDGRILEYEIIDKANNDDLKRVKDAVEKVKASDTEAGKRLKELDENPDVTVRIRVTREHESDVVAGVGDKESTKESIRKSFNGTGTDSTVYLNVYDMLSISTFYGHEIVISHEISGHAYDNHKGTNPRNRGGFSKANELLSEQRAVAMENEYRKFIGQKQRFYYNPGDGWNMPIYSNGRWYTMGGHWWHAK